ncbi:flippase [Acholeplasma equirhinis]|uniref:flippase n=1 Tax=Acholeplasma equirhinis TaxID=555393 RepID=UPI00197AEEE8|nr:flippase [Acholeplasma equirhinis]MBN3489999.1 flippase [Acholeplasma equirhinis]
MKKASLSKNYLYNLIYQVLAVIIPIILIPYLSRVLEPSGNGQYAFTYSITTYFSYFALLGVQLYGTKMISINQDDPYRLKKTFWEILALKGMTSAIAIVLFYGVLQFILPNPLFLIQGIWLFANLIDVTWYYTGSERFKSIVIRNSLIKLLSLAAILIFVKTINDVWIYAIILGGAELTGQLILWFSMRKEAVLKNIGEIKKDFNPYQHLKGTLVLFLPQVIILLYTSLNVTMIGAMTNDVQTGYYDQTSKIINTLCVIATSLATVMIPRISKLNEDGQSIEIENMLNKSIGITTYLAYPMMVGLFLVAPIFVPLFLGDLYIDAIPVLKLYAIKIGLVVFSNIIGVQYMIPTNKNKAFILSVSAGAVITLGLNLFLIPLYGALGAVIVSLIAELLVVAYQIWLVRKDMPFIKFIARTYKGLIASVVMAIYIIFAGNVVYLGTGMIVESFIQNQTIVTGLALAMLIGTSMIVYFVTNLILRTEIQTEILRKIFKRA